MISTYGITDNSFVGWGGHQSIVKKDKVVIQKSRGITMIDINSIAKEIIAFLDKRTESIKGWIQLEGQLMKYNPELCYSFSGLPDKKNKEVRRLVLSHYGVRQLNQIFKEDIHKGDIHAVGASETTRQILLDNADAVIDVIANANGLNHNMSQAIRISIEQEIPTSDPTIRKVLLELIDNNRINLTRDNIDNWGKLRKDYLNHRAKKYASQPIPLKYPNYGYDRGSCVSRASHFSHNFNRGY